MIRSNPTFRAAWETMSEEERRAFGRGHMALSQSLAESGELLAGEGLGDPSLAKLVAVVNGETVVSDGPFAESKEHLVGFLLVDCDTEERALGIAAQVPDARHCEIEVRPVLDVRGNVDWGDPNWSDADW
jgi:hypothetical protein